MPSALPQADPAPRDGLLPSTAANGAHGRDFGVYVHVPFCRVRCGYCDFNTYTATELRGVHRSDYAGQAVHEIESASRILDKSGVERRPVSTVFFGGGTPTMLPCSDLVRILDAVRATFGVVDGVEITTEANPDSVDDAYIDQLAAAGFTRISVGMQSAVPHVLSVLDRTHSPERVPVVVEAARRAGLQTSLDLIYGTPGESLTDWRESLRSAADCDPDHVSAYALIIEVGTALAREIRAGRTAAPDDELQADMYELADSFLSEAGYEWYEVSNWSRGCETQSRHNVAYWLGHDWWGVGPGAHSHVGGVRWWNVKHPAAYAHRIAAGESPAAAREVLSPETQYVERVLLRTRLKQGLATSQLSTESRQAVGLLLADGLIDPRHAAGGVIVLTRRGRLLADAVVRRLLP